MEIIPVTLNPNDAGSGFTLSNGNLTIVSSTDFRAIRATHGKTSGKWYWEVKYDSGVRNTHIGVSNKSFSLTGSIIATSPEWRTYYGNSGNKYPENTEYSTVWDVGNIIGVALDLDNGTLQFFKNGVSMGISHTNLKGMGEVFPTLGSFSGNSKTISINFGSSPFIYQAPSGFLAYYYKISNKILLSSGDKYYSAINKLKDDISVVPAMTSNTLPSGLVTASSIFSSTYDAYKAFDGSTSGSWQSANGLKTGYVSYTFKKGIIVGKYTIVSMSSNSSASAAPKDWTLEGSNDGLTWTVLDTQKSQTGWVALEKRVYSLNNTNKFKTYKVNITDNNGHASAVTIVEMELFERIKHVNSLDDNTESSFIKYSYENVPFNSKMTYQNDIIKTNSALGSGKTFEHTIDMSKRRADKITLG